MFEDERSPPDREIDKLQAIRHLLHSSIRLLLWEEDPFALHLICQSCDKLIIDCMKADGIESPVNFAAHVKPEYLKSFFAIYRETYNYLKHADEDRHAKLGVRNIVKNNELSIFLNVTRFALVNKSFWTAHVRYFMGYINFVAPIYFKDENMKRFHLENEQVFNSLSRSEVLEDIKNQALRDQEFLAERDADLVDIVAVSKVTIQDYKKSLVQRS